jgi:hypothetical protein
VDECKTLPPTVLTHFCSHWLLGPRWSMVPGIMGLHSSTFRLNVSTLCGIRWLQDFPPVYQTGGHGEV